MKQNTVLKDMLRTVLGDKAYITATELQAKALVGNDNAEWAFTMLRKFTRRYPHIHVSFIQLGNNVRFTIGSTMP